MSETKKMSDRKGGPQQIATSALHGVAFCAFATEMAFVVFTGGGVVLPFGFLLSIASIILLVMITPEYGKAISGQHQSRPSAIATWLVTGATYAVSSLLLVGVVQDLLHVYCRGFFGVEASCVSNWEFGLFITILNPIIYLVVVGGLLLLLLRSKRIHARSVTDNQR